jgi:outer membrane murein-binding lipoprotein Lpp
MSASHQPGRRGLIAALTTLLLVAGCASQPHAKQIHSPDLSALKPARQALHKAVSDHADQFAPSIVASARRRLTEARDILFSAAESGQPLTADQHDRIHTLVKQAQLDARAALAKTQAGAVEYQITRLKNSNKEGVSATESTGAEAQGEVAPGLGISRLNHDHGASEGTGK